jgi:hypothetical protein
MSAEVANINHGGLRGRVVEVKARLIWPAALASTRTCDPMNSVPDALTIAGTGNSRSRRHFRLLPSPKRRTAVPACPTSRSVTSRIQVEAWYAQGHMMSKWKSTEVTGAPMAEDFDRHRCGWMILQCC